MKDLTIVIFGVTGNLAELKLIPALFELWKNNNLPENFSIIGLSHKNRSDDELRELISRSLKNKNKKISNETINLFWHKFKFLNGDFGGEMIYQQLDDLLKNSEGNVIYYLATHPVLYQGIFLNLEKATLNYNSKYSVKIMVEKPIGNDQKTAKELNNLLRKYYREEQIFRIDHYLAKDTIQNILAFRFHNEVFESVWNNKKIDHIQITAAENFGAELRGTYYDKVGALKDVGQNHVLQMLAFILMDRPKEFNNEEVALHRIKVFQNLVANPNNLVLGQYENYSETKTGTNTFFAFKTWLKSGKFKNVPIYVRGGKRLAKTVAEISVIFKSNGRDKANVLTFRIQPNEGIIFKMSVKKPGFEMKCEDGTMQFCYRELGKLNDAYMRLLMDAILGEQTYFNNANEVELEWRFIDALKADKVSVIPYSAGSWGPNEADNLIRKDGREWLEPSESICQI